MKRDAWSRYRERDGRLELREAQRQVDAWISQFEEGYWPPLANLARLAEEVGELARELNAVYGSKPKKPEEPPGTIAEELGDVLFVVICLANALGIDLEAAFAATLAKYRRRDATRWHKKPGEPTAPTTP